MCYRQRSGTRLFLFIVVLVILLSTVPVSAADNYTKTFDNTSQVRINQSAMLYDYPGTDWTIWIISGVIGLGLFLLSLRPVSSKGNVQMNTVVSILSWPAIAFCGYASFAVDRLSSYGVTSQSYNYVLLENHIVYSFPVIGVLMFAFLVIAIINTLRLIALNKIFVGENALSMSEG